MFLFRQMRIFSRTHILSLSPCFLTHVPSSACLFLRSLPLCFHHQRLAQVACVCLHVCKASIHYLMQEEHSIFDGCIFCYKFLCHSLNLFIRAQNFQVYLQNCKDTSRIPKDIVSIDEDNKRGCCASNRCLEKVKNRDNMF